MRESRTRGKAQANEDPKSELSSCLRASRALQGELMSERSEPGTELLGARPEDS